MCENSSFCGIFAALSGGGRGERLAWTAALRVEWAPRQNPTRGLASCDTRSHMRSSLTSAQSLCAF